MCCIVFNAEVLNVYTSETIFYLKFALFILPTQCHISIYQCQCILFSLMLMGSTTLVFGKCYKIRYFLVCHMLIVFFPFFQNVELFPESL